MKYKLNTANTQMYID